MITSFICKFDMMVNNFFIVFFYYVYTHEFTYILMSQNKTRSYFWLPYFHVSNSSIFFAKYSGTLLFHRRCLDVFYFYLPPTQYFLPNTFLKDWILFHVCRHLRYEISGMILMCGLAKLVTISWKYPPPWIKCEVGIFVVTTLCEKWILK